MGALATSPVEDRDRILVEGAVARVQNFWPGVRVIRDGAGIALASERYGADELVSIWRCALLNERMVAASVSWRSALLAELVA